MNTTNAAQPYEHFAHWERIRNHDPRNGQRIRAGHTYYLIGPEPADMSPKSLRVCGFGGDEFRFRVHETGEVVISHNVWCQGDIPEALWNDPDFCDNADRIK